MKENKIYKKHFEYKGQMINYWNKLINNDNIAWCTKCLDVKEGYIIKYQYK